MFLWRSYITLNQEPRGCHLFLSWQGQSTQIFCNRLPCWSCLGCDPQTCHFLTLILGKLVFKSKWWIWCYTDTVAVNLYRCFTNLKFNLWLASLLLWWKLANSVLDGLTKYSNVFYKITLWLIKVFIMKESR